MNFEKNTHNNGENTENSEVNVYLIIEMDVTQNSEIFIE